MLQHLKAVYNERFVSSVDSVREPRYQLSKMLTSNYLCNELKEYISHAQYWHVICIFTTGINMQTSNSTKINRIRMPPPGGDASFGVSISIISESLYCWLTRFTLTVYSNDMDSELTFSTSKRKPLVWTLLESSLLRTLYYQSVQSIPDQSHGLTWRIGLRRQLPMQQLTRFWELGGVFVSIRLTHSINIWFAQIQRHLVQDGKAKESAALFFSVTQWSLLRFLQSPWLLTLTPVDRAEE